MQSLLSAEGVDLVFSDASLKEIARCAEHINKNIDNIGARRLHTLIERIVEEVGDCSTCVRRSGSRMPEE